MLLMSLCYPLKIQPDFLILLNCNKNLSMSFINRNIAMKQ